MIEIHPVRARSRLSTECTLESAPAYRSRCQTDVGRKRAHNEDNFAIMAEYGLYVVADGMGGHASGEVASKMAVDTLQEFFAATADDPERTWPYKMDRGKGYEENRLITGIKLCNLRIYEQAQRNAKQRGMGTTLAALFAVEERSVRRARG